MVLAGTAVPEAWARVFDDPLVRQIGFTSVEEATRELDTVQFSVTTNSERERSWSRGHFFAVYQQLDAHVMPSDSVPLTLQQRNRAAAAAAVGVDAIVTAAPTVGRSDVADNDIVPSVTPEDATALIGHYLRLTSNPVVQVLRGDLLGGGTGEQTESTATIGELI